MANDCLQTKLKSVVSNPNLKVLGRLELKTLVDFNNYVFLLQGKITLTVPGGNIKDANNYDLGDSVDINNMNAPYPRELKITVPKDSYIYIDNKYGLKVLNCGYSKVIYPINTKEFSSLSYVENMYANLSGALSNLNILPNLSVIQVYSGEELTGDVNDLYREDRASIRALFPAVCPVTFNGKKPIVGNIYVLNNKENTITWETRTKYVVLNNQYAATVGYSDEEIATNIAAGGIWEGRTNIPLD